MFIQLIHQELDAFIRAMLLRFFIISSLFFILVGLTTTSAGPKVVSTHPKHISKNVDPQLKVISVTFDQPMLNDSWSWVQDSKQSFPKITGKPYYDAKFKTNHLPVVLESNKSYIIWINSRQFQNFKSNSGVSVQPYKFEFKTK